MSSIWQAIHFHYEFQSTGTHFLDFNNIKLAPDKRPEDLYQRLISFIEDNLLLANDNISHDGKVPGSNPRKSGCTYSAAQIYANYAYAYYTSVLCVYAYVNTRTYTRIYAHICAYIRAYMSLCYAFPQVSLCEAVFVKQRTLHFWEWKRLQSEICMLLKRPADQWKLSYFEFSIHFANSPTNYRLLTLAWS